MGEAKIPQSRLQHSIRSKTGAQTFWGPGDVKLADGFQSPENVRLFEYSKDGNLYAVLSPENVLIFNSQTGQVAHTIVRANVSALAFSPLNSFVVTWERLDEKANGNENNLLVWRLETAEPVARFTQKVFAADLWPSLSWTKDETYFARATKTEVQLYAAKSVRANEAVRRLPLANVARVEFSPVIAQNGSYHLAVFVPEAKSQPGSVRIYSIPPSQGPDQIRATATKTFFRGTSANLMWNSTGTALLASLSTDVDVTGKSYYGETGLYFLTTDASFECMIQLQKEGPIHDVSWSPTGKEFVVVYGFMPNPQTTLFDVKCNPVIDFGTASRNTIRWSPNGKLLCIGGFGNLTGQMDFWDVKEAKKVGSAIAHCAAICEWAPDSRHFIAAVVSPRIRVDNGYKIFKYDGTLVHETPVNELYQVAWRPRPTGFYQERPLTPPKPGAGPSSPSVAQAKPAAAPAPAKYRHPNAAREAPSQTASSDEGVKRYKPAAAVAEKNLPPGWFDDEEEQKKKKKKEKNKKKKAAAGSSSVQDVSEGVEALSVSSTPTTTTTTTPSSSSSSDPSSSSSPSPAPSSPSPSSVASPPQPNPKKAAAQSPRPQQQPRKAPNQKK